MFGKKHWTFFYDDNLTASSRATRNSHTASHETCHIKRKIYFFCIAGACIWDPGWDVSREYLKVWKKFRTRSYCLVNRGPRGKRMLGAGWLNILNSPWENYIFDIHSGENQVWKLKWNCGVTANDFIFNSTATVLHCIQNRYPAWLIYGLDIHGSRMNRRRTAYSKQLEPRVQFNIHFPNTFHPDRTSIRDIFQFRRRNTAWVKPRNCVQLVFL